MATDRFIMPPDPSPAGRNEATRSRTEDSVTKHWSRIIVEDNRVRTGFYNAHTGAHVVSAASQALPAGFWWLFNPVASTVLVAFKGIHWMSQMGSVLVSQTSPRLVVQKFTSTTDPTGAVILPVKSRTSHANNVATVRSANTGLTFTQIGALYSFLPVASATAVGFAPADESDWMPPPEGQPILAAGEGLMLYQPDVGVSGDTRRFTTNVMWEEFTEF